MKNNRLFNRELSWLLFNERVLEEAEDESNPLLERLKFLAIYSSNLDEFFMIRFAGIKDQILSQYEIPDFSGMLPAEQAVEIMNYTHELQKRVYVQWENFKIGLEKKEIIVLNHIEKLPEEALKNLQQVFLKQIYPVITPVAIDPTHPFPFLYNKSLNILFVLKNSEGLIKHAIVPVPGILSRFYKIEWNKKTYIILIEDILKYFKGNLFPGYEAEEFYCFRITRNADLTVDEEGAEDLLTEIQDRLKERRHGAAVRIEVEGDLEHTYFNEILEELEVKPDEIYSIQGPIDLSFGFSLYGELAKKLKEGRYADFQGVTVSIDNFFEVLKKRDLLFHHPYESFQAVAEFLRQAAEDPNVLAIKQTLYRANKKDSEIVQQLIKAAENGKQVTVLLELRARFDEEMNIGLAKKLERVGCHVIYGMKGLKTHAKSLLVVRRENNGSIKRYMHFGTGNYNEETSKIYTDISYFTSQEDLAQDASSFFNFLTGYSVEPEWKKFSVSPDGIKRKLIQLIENEMEKHLPNSPGKIIAKMNALVDPDVIEKLYEASAKGVSIDLIVRGVCCLKPGEKGLSENIRVRSIVGRFLEHSRIIYFKNAGEELFFISSADWMPRNLVRRVELMVPIESKECREKLRQVLELNLKDTEKARLLEKGKYHRVKKTEKIHFSSQNEFLKIY